jgi:hypothetical protein
VIAATMEDVELFLAPLTARSKVREVLRGLVATRQVHTISMGHAPHFYVAGTLPEFAEPPTIYASSSMPAHAYFLRSRDHEEETTAHEATKPASPSPATRKEPGKPAESHTPRTLATHKTDSSGRSAAARPHFSRPAAHSRNRKPAQTSSSSRPSTRSGARPARRSSHEARPLGARPVSGARWKPNTPASTHGNRNGVSASNGSSKGARSNGNGSRPASGTSGNRSAKSAVTARGQRNGHISGINTTGKPAVTARGGGSRKPASIVKAKAGNSKRFSFHARPKQKAKKRG